jgi:hypothetical protein
MSHFVSPDEMVTEAIRIQLHGKAPRTPHDWVMIMNFIAWNLVPSVAHDACQLMAKVYSMPLSEAEVTDIVSYQVGKRAERN